MKRATGLLLTLIAAVFSLSLLIVLVDVPETTQGGSPTKKPSSGRVDLAIDQSFSVAPGSTIDYNVYIRNEGSSMETFTLTASSDQGYFVEVWQDTDHLNGGDIQLIPPQGYNMTLDAGEVVTLVARVTIPSEAIDGMADATMIEAVSPSSGASDSVTLITTVNSDLPYPSDWIQLGSDPLIPSQPDKVDIKALYYTNDGAHVFFRMAEADKPAPISFRYIVYLDTRVGGQQIGGYGYDYFLSSDGVLYEWNGTGWANSGWPTYFQTDGTSIVLWADLDNLGLDTQDIQILSRTATKDMVIKDTVGPYKILRNNISEIPLALVPLVTLAIFFVVSNKRKSCGIRGREGPR
jgi:hypothetical protein